MADIQHEDIPLGERHAPHDWEYADAAARAAAVITDIKYVGRQALQLDDGSYWRLSAVAPAVWVGIAAQGAAGTNGTDGAAGLSAYEVAVVEGFVGDEAAWLLSLQGAPGTDGSSFTINAQGLLAGRSAYDSEAENFSYLATDTGNLYIRQTATAGTWSDPIPFGQGADGAPGADGAAGADGKSAYEVAVFNGFMGTEVEWLASLNGAAGSAGADGTNGADGADGLSAYQIAVAGGFVGDQAAWLLSLKGATGDAGTAGTNGTDGVDGLSAYQIAVAAGFVGDQVAWLASLQGTDGAAGTNGSDGVDGLSAYEVAVAGGFIGDQAAWLLSLQGVAGTDGADGAVGTSTITHNPIIVATAGQTDFPIDGGEAGVQLWLYGNGRKLSPNGDYSIAPDGLTFTLAVAAAAGEEFEPVVISGISLVDNTAASISIADAGGNFTATTVEAALAELASASKPSFRATLSGVQTIAQNTTTVVALADETFDVGGCFNTTTYRFTPNVPGRYSVTAAMQVINAPNKNLLYQVYIRKNGVIQTAQSYTFTTSSGAECAASVTDIIAMNGTTDYLDMAVYHYDYTSGAAIGLQAINGATRFMAQYSSPL